MARMLVIPNSPANLARRKKPKKARKRTVGLTMEYPDRIVKCTHKLVSPGPGMLFITGNAVDCDGLTYIVHTEKGLALIHRNDLREIAPSIWRPKGVTQYCVAETNVLAWVEEGPKHVDAPAP